MTEDSARPGADLALRFATLVARTERLHALTARMSALLRVDEIAELVVAESVSAFEVVTAALWRLDDSADGLVLLGARNYPPEALALVQRLPLEHGRPISDAVLRREPVWLTSRAQYEAEYPASGARTASMSRSAGAIAAIPIVLGDEALGALALTFGEDRELDTDERRFLTMLAFHCAQGFERARLHRAETAAREAATERATFLARASALLGSSLDYEETLRNVAALAVPRIGDWCGVELVDPETGGTKQVAVAHVDPAKVQLAHDLRARYPPDPNAQTGIPNILRTGKPEFYPDIRDELLVAGAVDADHLRIIRELGLSSAMAVPISDRGTIVGVITFILSNTSRRYTTDDLLMAEQLAERSGAAIGNARLYAAANAAIRLRDDFVSVAGHELRTPLGALRLHLESQLQVRDGTPLEKLRERARKMLMQASRLERLVEELLDVSKLTGGRLTLELATFDLGELAAEVLDRLRDESDAARCPTRLNAEVVTGCWDRGRLDQVLMNLLTNAIKYGKGARIEVSVRRDGRNAIVEVQDHGIGIAPTDQERIFHRFERAVSVRNFGGMGLGLWITKQVVEMHGGTIHVRSELGQGATFEVRLPVTDDPPPARVDSGTPIDTAPTFGGARASS